MSTSPFYVYMLLCKGDTIYTGMTNNLTARIITHCKGTSGSAKYTRSHKPVALLAYWECQSRSEALKLERKFKTFKRSQKLAAAQEQQPHNSLDCDWIFERDTAEKG